MAGLFVAHLAISHVVLLSQSSQTGVIVGRVLDIDSGTAIDNVVLQLQTNGQGLSRAVVSGSDGQFLFTGLSNGTYRVVARTTGAFLPATFAGLSPELFQTVVDIRPDHHVIEVTIPLRKSGSLSGLVSDALNNQPLANVRVVAFRRVFDQGASDFAVAGQSTTDELGRFRIGGLAADDYSLCVPVLFATLPSGFLSHYQDVASGTTADGKQLISSAVSFGVLGGAVDGSQLIASSPMIGGYEGSASERTVLTSTCYLSARDVFTSQTITLTPGQAVSGLDIAVAHERAVRVSGSVFIQGVPAKRAILTLMPSELASSPILGEQLATAKTMADDSGHFELPFVPVGTYQLEASGPSAGSRVQQPATGISSVRQPIQINMDASETLELRPGRTISGTVDVPASSTIRPFDFSKSSLNLVPIDGHSAEQIIPIGPNRTFVTSGHPTGRYKIRPPNAPSGLVVAKIARGTTELVDQILDLSDEDIQDLHITLAVGGILQGTVTQSSGSAPIVVVIFQPSRVGLVGISSAIGTLRGARVGPDAAFSVDALANGDYCAVALDTQDRAALSRLLAAAKAPEHCTSVHTGESSFLTLTVKK